MASKLLPSILYPKKLDCALQFYLRRRPLQAVRGAPHKPPPGRSSRPRNKMCQRGLSVAGSVSATHGSEFNVNEDLKGLSRFSTFFTGQRSIYPDLRPLFTSATQSTHLLAIFATTYKTEEDS